MNHLTPNPHIYYLWTHDMVRIGILLTLVDRLVTFV